MNATVVNKSIQEMHETLKQILVQLERLNLDPSQKIKEVAQAPVEVTLHKGKKGQKRAV